MSGVNWTALIILVVLFGAVTIMGFMATRTISSSPFVMPASRPPALFVSRAYPPSPAASMPRSSHCAPTDLTCSATSGRTS